MVFPEALPATRETRLNLPAVAIDSEYSSHSPGFV